MEIALSRGKTALCDDRDASLVMGLAWHVHGNKGRMYARHDWRDRGRLRTVYMHTLLMCPPPGMQVDHINGNGLDNRRCNLRLCTNEQNLRNCGPRKRNKSGFKGVSRCADRDKWEATIYFDGKKRHLGRFHDKEEAARAYDKAARERFGEFAKLNFPVAA